MKSIYKISWSGNAIKELENTIDYLEKNFSMKEISNLVLEIEKVSALLAKNPKLFPIVSSKTKLRKVVVMKFNNLYYTFDEETVNIASFYSNRQKEKF
ncbi:MAG: type II toxin-antitoxin system RelE/ParE family toxin [Chitinophagales bacterium]